MTKDEAKELVEIEIVYFCDDPETKSNVDEVIDRIYDEFEQEQAETKKMTRKEFAESKGYDVNKEWGSMQEQAYGDYLYSLETKGK